MRIVLDMGSGNTCRNDIGYIKKMIDAVSKVDTKKHEVILKWQLFKEAGQNVPLYGSSFDFAFTYAKEEHGYKTTASVFCLSSLAKVLYFDKTYGGIPFIKIANNPKLYWLIGEIPRRIPVYVSVGDVNALNGEGFGIHKLGCVSEYPADIESYNGMLTLCGVSDHTTDWELFKQLGNHCIYEVHFKLDDSTGLDAGPFARTPAQLAEIL